MGSYRSLLVIVAMEAVSRAFKSPDDDLDVMARPPGHFVTDQPRLLKAAGLPDRAAELAQLVPDNLVLALAVPLKPMSRQLHAQDSAPPIRRVSWPPARQHRLTGIRASGQEVAVADDEPYSGLVGGRYLRLRRAGPR
jgi:hypothetical protein